MTLKFKNDFEIQPSSESSGGGGGSNLKYTIVVEEEIKPVAVQIQVTEGT